MTEILFHDFNVILSQCKKIYERETAFFLNFLMHYFIIARQFSGKALGPVYGAADAGLFRMNSG